MDYSRDLLSLLPRLLELAGDQPLPSLGASLLVALAIAAGGWVGAVSSARLWNRAYRPRLWHHLFCSVVALLTFGVVAAWPGIRFVHGVSGNLVRAWDVAVHEDAGWRRRAAVEAQRVVQGLQPDGVGAARQTTLAYAEAAGSSLGREYPLLGQLVQTHAPALVNSLGDDFLLQAGDAGADYALNGLVTAANATIRDGFLLRIHRAATAALLGAALLLILLQSLAFGLIGYSAHRDIKLHV